MEAIANKGVLDHRRVISRQEMEIEKMKHHDINVIQVLKKNHMDKST